MLPIRSGSLRRNPGLTLTQKNKMNIAELSDTELKALAFEQIVQRDQAVQNLQVIVEEIGKRSKAAQESPAAESEEPVA